jgi:hypothetical protein
MVRLMYCRFAFRVKGEKGEKTNYGLRRWRRWEKRGIRGVVELREKIGRRGEYLSGTDKDG